MREYLAGFANRYGERASAKAELDGVLQQLYRDHPDLDANRVYQMFDRMFPDRPQSAAPSRVSSIDMYGPDQHGRTPIGQPASTATQRPPTADPQLEAEVRALTQQYDQSKDQDERAAIERRMRQILDGVKGQAR